MNTAELMKEIYDKVLYFEPDVQEAEKEVCNEVLELVDSVEVTDAERERIRDMLCSVQHSSMRIGYITGALHTLRVLLNTLSGS